MIFVIGVIGVADDAVSAVVSEVTSPLEFGIESHPTTVDKQPKSATNLLQILRLGRFRLVPSKSTAFAASYLTPNLSY
jgi:hypothetical protein